MEAQDRRQVVLLGLDDRLLWQLTRTLAGLEDVVHIACVQGAEEAGEICASDPTAVVVVDGWERARETAGRLGGEEAFREGGWKWVVLTESLPLESLPGPSVSASVRFVEKPFNPKAFPSLLLQIAEGRQRLDPSPQPERRVGFDALPLTPGETYSPPPGAEDAEVSDGGPPLAPSVPADRPAHVQVQARFHRLVDEGFDCLSRRDWDGVRRTWEQALAIRPDDRRLRANLDRLERLREAESSTPSPDEPTR